MTLSCGHPGNQNNLHNGKCGTCWMADQVHDLLEFIPNSPNRENIIAIERDFRSGKIVFDTNGKTFMEYSKLPEIPPITTQLASTEDAENDRLYDQWNDGTKLKR